MALGASVLLKQPTASSFGPSQLHEAEGTMSGIFVSAWMMISGIWMCQGSETTQLWVRTEIKGRREVLWQLSALVL